MNTPTLNDASKTVTRTTQITVNARELVALLQFANPQDLDIQAMPATGVGVSLTSPNVGLAVLSFSRKTG